MALYIESQNAGIIFRKVSPEYLSFESFELSLPCETIVGTTGKVVMQFPANPRLPVSSTPETIKSLANILAFLDATQISDAMPSTRKASSQHVEVRDTASPRYITEALAGILRGAGPDYNVLNPTIYIQKRLDDHVLWDSAYQPWRRSSLLLLSRVALQTTLKEANLEGNEGYKSFQAFAMGLALNEACLLDQPNIPSDLLHEMNKKLAKRLWKMRDDADRNQHGPIRSAGEAVINTAKTLHKRWEHLRQHFSKKLKWSAPDDQAIKSAITLSLPNSNQFLRTLVQRTQVLLESSDVGKFNHIDDRLASECHYRMTTSGSSTLPLEVSGEEQDMRLHDIETWIALNLTSWTSSSARSESDCRRLSDLITSYVASSASAYKEKPELLSHMYLCMLELWIALDTITLKFYPLLAEYSPEIPVDYLDSLLLPHWSQMQRLNAVEKHLQQRHCTAAKHENASIFADPNRSSSFANRYFTTSKVHQDLLSKVQKWDEKKKAEKSSELGRLNEKYHGLKAKAEALDCNDTEVWDKKKVHRIEKHIRKRCHKCKLNHQASKLSITLLEDTLPVETYRAQPIVFELNCPEGFGVWRDSTYNLFNRSQKKPPQSESFWSLSKYPGLENFFTAKGFRISLASSAKPLDVSHYGNTRSLPEIESNIFHSHAGRYQLLDTTSQTAARITLGGGSLHADCTLKLEGSFQSLQAFIEDTKHTPNQVIASQSTSPQDVSLGQYIAFGHVRAGNRIQWWNVMRVLRSQSLPLSHGDVYTLFVQTIWQAGPEKECGISREAHADLLDPKFRLDTIKELNESIVMLGNNWREPFSLATVVTIATRVYSLTPSKERESIRKVLENARTVALKWIQLAKEELGSLSIDAAAHCRSIISQLAAIFRSSFDIESDPNEISPLLTSLDNLVSFLYATILIASSGVQETSLLLAVQLLFRRDRRLGYRVEEILKSAILQNPEILHAAIGRHWPDYSRGTQWRALRKPADRWLASTTPDKKSPLLHFNILTGTLLIDGALSGTLPSPYLSHPSFKKLFGESVSTVHFLSSREALMTKLYAIGKLTCSSLHNAWDEIPGILQWA